MFEIAALQGQQIGHLTKVYIWILFTHGDCRSQSAVEMQRRRRECPAGGGNPFLAAVAGK